MGCDGGTIPKRDELVKTKKKPEQKDKQAELAFRWRNCAASQQPLQGPIVACELGRLYKKESVLECLLDKSKVTEVVSHLRSLKDVKELNFTQNPDWTDGEQMDNSRDEHKSQWICPVTGQEMNGKFRFNFLWTCGCVMSERAMKEVGKQNNGSEKTECLKCLKPYTLDDVVLLNPVEEEDVKLARIRMETRREKAKAEKKGKKQKSSVIASVTVVTCDEAANKSFEATASSSHSRKRTDEQPVPQSSQAKKSKLTAASNGVIANGSTTSKVLDKFSVANNPKASDTYKSLFTSHPDAKKQEKAHWVTYNPFYN